MPDALDMARISIDGQNEKRFILLRFVLLWIAI